MRRSATIFYASHNWHPFFLQGTKTLAYELWEDLGFRAPDNVIIPVRRRVERAGLRASALPNCCAPARSTSMPRIFAAQPANCAPIAARIPGRHDAPCHRDQPDHRRGHRDRPADPRCAKSWASLRETRGGAVMLSEAEIAAATLDLARIGVYVEPTCAAGRRGLSQAAGRRHDHAGADDGAGADRHRAEIDAADRRTAGGQRYDR